MKMVWIGFDTHGCVRLKLTENPAKLEDRETVVAVLKGLSIRLEAWGEQAAADWEAGPCRVRRQA